MFKNYSLCIAAVGIGLWSLRAAPLESTGTHSIENHAVVEAAAESRLELARMDDGLATLRPGEPGVVPADLVEAVKPPIAVALTTIVECGSSAGFFSAAQETGFGPNAAAAMADARARAEATLWGNTDAECTVCADGEPCDSGVETLDANWKYGPVLPAGAGFKVTASYFGAYAFVCDPCIQDPD